MLTITSKLQMDQYRKEANLLELEQHVNSNELTKFTERLANYEEDAVAYGEERAKNTKDSNGNPMKFDKEDFLKEFKAHDETYLRLSAYSSACETRNASIESELKMLNDAMSSFEKEHQSGIKSDTSFWCFGG